MVTNIFKYCTILLALCFLSSCNKTFKKKYSAKIKFEEYEHNLQQVEVEDTIQCSFTFLNTGKDNLYIYKVNPSCDCTIVNLTKRKIPRGGQGKILIKFSSPFPKSIDEKILVYYNGSDSPIVLSIYGEAVTRL